MWLLQKSFVVLLAVMILVTAGTRNASGQQAKSAGGKDLPGPDVSAFGVDSPWYDAVREDLLKEYAIDDAAEPEGDTPEQRRRLIIGGGVFSVLTLGGLLGWVFGYREKCKSRTSPRCTTIQSPSS